MIKGMFITLSGLAILWRRCMGIGALLALSLLTCASVAWALPPGAARSQAAGGIAVIYPDLGEPYRSIFAQIIGGIEDKTKGRVVAVPIGAEVNAGELNDTLHRQGVRVAIALGRQGMKAATVLDRNIGVVVGGVLVSQSSEARNMQVHILSPDPALLFSRLKEMMPKVRRVFVVYDTRQNAWMMRQAKEAARTHGVEFVAHDAQDLRSAMRAYQEIFANADPRHDALWLPQDSTTVEESTVMPLVLQESWSRALAVFSSNFGHVKRGALFSLYPDNTELGRRLGASAQAMLASGASDGSGMAPLREVLIAVNLRTAKHVGANATRDQGFDMMYPEP